MTNLILANGSGNLTFYITLGVIIGIFVVMIMMQSRRRKAAQAEYMGMIDQLKVGTRVKTVGGVIGRIVEIREEAPAFKTVLIETGSDKSKTLVLYDLQAIYGVVDDEALAAARREKEIQAQQTDITNHEPADKGVNRTQNSFEAKKPSKKSNN